MSRRHWWREYVTAAYWDQMATWTARRESSTPVRCAGGDAGTVAYQMEDQDYALAYPRPTFRETLERLGGGRR